MGTSTCCQALYYDDLIGYLHLQADVRGKNCILTEPVYGTKFDLNLLTSTVGHKIDADGQDIIEFNVCNTNFSKICAGSKSVACFKRKENEYKFGMLDCWKTFIIYLQQSAINKLERCLFDTGTEHEIEPIYTNGRIYFNYTGDICEKKTNETFNLIIILTCDYSSHIRNPITLMPYVSRAHLR